VTAPPLGTPATGVLDRTVVRAVLSVSFVDALGSGIFLASAPVLAVTALHQPAPLVGLTLGLSGLAGLSSSVPLGRFSDRRSPRGTLIGLHMIRGLVVSCFGLATSAPLFLALLVALGAAEGGVSPLTQSLVAQHLAAPDRLRRMAQVRTVRNAGFCGGSLVAAAVLLLAPRPAALAVGVADALSFMASAALLCRVPAWSAGQTGPDAGSAGGSSGTADAGSGPAAGRFRVTVIGILSGALSVHATMLTVALPLWITQVAQLPASLAAAAIAVNAVIVILLQVRVSDRLDRQRPAIGIFSVAAVALVLGLLPFALPASLPVPLLLAAAGVGLLAVTVAELVHSVAAWEAGFALASERDRAADLARFNLGLLGQEITAPLLLTALLSLSSPGPWVVLGVLLLGCGRAADRLTPGTCGKES
jgi:uncharacterized protein (DUF983 family)